MCHDNFSRPYCAKITEGGCPCSNSDEVKCGANQYYSGYCAIACCDWTVEQACFDENNKLIGCARLDGGGCDPKQRKIGRWPAIAPTGMHPSPSITIYDANTPGPTKKVYGKMRPSPSMRVAREPTSNARSGGQPYWRSIS